MINKTDNNTGEIIKLKILNCNINLSFYFVAVSTFFLIIGQKCFLLTVFSSLIHEIGHIFAIINCGEKISKIKINAFSIDIEQNYNYNTSEKKELFILLCGPITNLSLFLIFIISYKILNFNIFKIFSIQNLIIGILNLMPIYSLDGGQILLIFLRRRLNVNVADKILFIISIIFILPITTLSFFLIIKSNFNFSLLILIFYLISLLLKNN